MKFLILCQKNEMNNPMLDPHMMNPMFNPPSIWNNPGMMGMGNPGMMGMGNPMGMRNPGMMGMASTPMMNMMNVNMNMSNHMMAMPPHMEMHNSFQANVNMNFTRNAMNNISSILDKS